MREWCLEIAEKMFLYSLVREEETTFRLKSSSGPVVLLINRSVTVVEVLIRLKHILLDTWQMY